MVLFRGFLRTVGSLNTRYSRGDRENNFTLLYESYLSFVLIRLALRLHFVFGSFFFTLFCLRFVSLHCTGTVQAAVLYLVAPKAVKLGLSENHRFLGQKSQKNHRFFVIFYTFKTKIFWP